MQLIGHPLLHFYIIDTPKKNFRKQHGGPRPLDLEPVCLNVTQNVDNVNRPISNIGFRLDPLKRKQKKKD